MILLVVYGCGTWSLTLRAEYRLRVFDSGVLRETFGAKRGGSEGREDRTER
jgi:hypothetical protein